MTLSHWFRDDPPKPLEPFQSTRVKPKLFRLDNYLRAAISEANPLALIRQQAGQTKGNKRRKLGTKARRKKGGGMPSTPNHHVDLSSSNKNKLARLALKKQRKLPSLRGPPVPNFAALHRLWERRNHSRQLNSMHKITEPRTPKTLLKSMKAEERWRGEKLRLQRQAMKELTLQPNLSNLCMELWRKPPFVPRIQSSVVKTQPFHLRSVERGKLRKQFDVWNMQEQRARWIRRATEWAKRYRREYAEARKQTVFKARPNPWKRLKPKVAQKAL